MALSHDHLDAILSDLRSHRGDTTGVEVKQAADGLPRDIGSTICAFANMPDGGVIILGVSEAGGSSTTGIADPAQMEAGLASVARQSVHPQPFLETISIDHGGLAVVTARVAPLPPALKPATYRGDAYLRQADGDYVMGPADLRMIEVAKLHDREQIASDSVEVAGASRADLDADIVHALLSTARRSSRRLRQLDDEDLLRQLGATTASGKPTVAGLYALGNFPQGVLPALRVTAAVQLPRDGGGARTQNLRVLDGPLPDLLEAAMDWVSTNLTTRQVYRADGHLRSEPEIPLRAVREAIANALVHRDLGPDTLGVGRSIDIRLSEGALTITSPGGLRGVTLRQITSSSHARAAVNQRLYALAQHLRTADGSNIIEGEGGGVTEILRSTVEADLRRPRLVDTGVQFTAIMWRGSTVSEDDADWLAARASGRELTHLQKQVLLKARTGRAWSIDTLREEFSPMTLEEAQAQLSQLVAARLISADLAEPVPVQISSPRAENAATASPRAPSGPHDRIVSAGKNAPAVWGAIEGSVTIGDITERTSLTVDQVRYALSKLIDVGLVGMDGGQGKRQTTYRRLHA